MTHWRRPIHDAHTYTDFRQKANSGEHQRTLADVQGILKTELKRINCVRKKKPATTVHSIGTYFSSSSINRATMNSSERRRNDARKDAIDERRHIRDSLSTKSTKEVVC